MTKFNRPGITPRVTGPIDGPGRPTGRTHQGGEGFGRDLKSELFLLATTNLVGEDTFYEDAKRRDGRFQELVRRAAVADPTWTAGLLVWLRGPGNLRSAPIVGACEFVKARLAAGPSHTDPTAWNQKRGDAEAVGLNRHVIDRVCQRQDEPGELIAYWTSRYGRKLPMPVKRGTADAMERLTSEYGVLKYDTSSHAYRVGDVLELAHPHSKAPWQGELYKHALDRRHGREINMEELAGQLPMVYAEHALRDDAKERPQLLLNPQNLKEAGFTWNDALSLGGSRLDKKRLWEALVDADALPYGAMLKNLRNLTQAGVDDAYASKVMERIMDPERVKRSRLLPLRFLSAYRAAGDDLRWAWPLESALDLSLGNVPQLDGRTLVLVDTSGSMNNPLSERSELKRWDAAALFGIALGRRCMAADVVSFSSPVRNYWRYDRGTDQRPSGGSVVFPMTQGSSLLSSLQRWQNGGYFLDGGTDTGAAVREHLKRHHDRLVIITDEQAMNGVPRSVPDDVRTHTINLAGYTLGHLPASAPNRWTFGGLTDNVFHTMMHVERAQDATWPWEVA